MSVSCSAIEGELKLYESKNIIKWISIILKLKVKKKTSGV